MSITTDPTKVSQFPCRTRSASLHLGKLQTKQKTQSQKYYHQSIEEQKTAVA